MFKITQGEAMDIIENQCRFKNWVIVRIAGDWLLITDPNHWLVQRQNSFNPLQ